MMGTVVEVISPDKRAAGIAFREIERIEGLLSYYNDESEISRLNRQGTLRVSKEVLFIINKAREFWEASDGLFDITVSPLVELWGFYDKNYHIPGDLQIKEKLSLIGFDKIEINDSIIRFKKDGMRIDLGAIAKGYAIDCAVNKLRLAGVDSALLNAGGEIYCLGDKFGYPWRVAIRVGKQLDNSGYLELIDKAVATSGDYEQYFSVNNIRYCHILNPKTGRPVTSGVLSVSVIADDCLTADALATSIFILGESRGRQLANRFNAEVKIYTDVQSNKQG